jgi:hypothetical protein
MRKNLIATAAVASIALSMAACGNGTTDDTEAVAQSETEVEAPTEADANEAPPGTYGSDPAMDALWDECEAGDTASCDSLYWESPSGSEYEAFAEQALANVTDSEGTDGETMTAEVGDTVTMGDWDVTVTKVVKNADGIIRDANQFNDPAEGQYVLVTIEGTYNGSERKGDFDWDIDTYFVGADNVIYDEDSEVTPADVEDWPLEARNGATVKMQEVYDVASGQVKGGILGVENFGTGDYYEFPVS